MRILALDHGTKRVGVAVSDPTGTLATSLAPIQRRGLRHDIATIAALVSTEAAEKVLLGLPLSLSGEAGPQARLVLDFKAALERALDVPVETWDERYSTSQAEEVLRSQGLRGKELRGRVDSVAAALLLQEYLNIHVERPSVTEEHG